MHCPLTPSGAEFLPRGLHANRGQWAFSFPYFLALHILLLLGIILKSSHCVFSGAEVLEPAGTGWKLFSCSSDFGSASQTHRLTPLWALLGTGDSVPPSPFWTASLTVSDAHMCLGIQRFHSFRTGLSSTRCWQKYSWAGGCRRGESIVDPRNILALDIFLSRRLTSQQIFLYIISLSNTEACFGSCN